MLALNNRMVSAGASLQHPCRWQLPKSGLALAVRHVQPACTDGITDGKRKRHARQLAALYQPRASSPHH